MAENTVKKIATRESYGNSLKELAEEFPNLVVLDADSIISLCHLSQKFSGIRNDHIQIRCHPLCHLYHIRNLIFRCTLRKCAA